MPADPLFNMLAQVQPKLALAKKQRPKREANAPMPCIECNDVVDPALLRDDLSRKEWKISGLCQSCQDKMFGAKN